MEAEGIGTKKDATPCGCARAEADVTERGVAPGWNADIDEKPIMDEELELDSIAEKRVP